MNDSEWFHCNPDRLVRRRRLPGDPEMWIISLHDTSETLVVNGRFAAVDDGDEVLHVVATELLLEGIVDAERMRHALWRALEAIPLSAVHDTESAGADATDKGYPAGSGAIWPSVPENVALRENHEVSGKA